jgi:hypothetical protein
VTVNLIETNITRPIHPLWYKEYSEWPRVVLIRAMVKRAIDAFRGRKVTSNKVTQIDKYWMAEIDPESGEFGKTIVRNFMRLLPHELYQAKLDFISQVQRESYPDDFKAILDHKKPPRKIFYKLKPHYEAVNKVIRCTSRQKQYLTYQEQDALVLLPPEHYLTEVLFREIHQY